MFMRRVLLTVFAGSLLCGCAANRPVMQRGWIDGEYINAHSSMFARGYSKEGDLMAALPKQVKKDQCGAVFVQRVFDKTPAAEAGIKAGDLIFRINGSAVKNVKEFYKTVDNLTPGSAAIVTLYRNGEILEKTVIAGKESYKKFGSLTIGFGIGTKVDLIPHPDFNWFSLVHFSKKTDRVSLYSPENEYIKSLGNNSGQRVNRLWDAWLLVIGLGKNENIVNQEIVPANQK